jgi:hypothetical protein
VGPKVGLHALETKRDYFCCNNELLKALCAFKKNNRAVFSSTHNIILFLPRTVTTPRRGPTLPLTGRVYCHISYQYGPGSFSLISLPYRLMTTRTCYIHEKFPKLTHLHSEDGGSMFLRNIGIHRTFADRCAPWKIANGAETLFCRRCNLIRWVSAAKSHVGQA